MMSRNLALCLALLLVSCSDRARSESVPISTVVAVSSTCPVSQLGNTGWVPQEFGPLIAPLIAALLPSAVGGAWDALAAQVHAKASDKDRTVTAKTGTPFYSASRSGTLSPGSQLGCLFFASGPALALGSDPPKATSGPLSGLTENGRGQLTNAGVTGDLNVYAEAILQFSDDHTAFRLVPQRLFYEKTVDMQDRSSLKGLALTATFRKPSGATAGEAFAVATIALPFARPGHEYSAKELGSSSRRLASNWMPLPAIDAQIAQKLTSASENAATVNSNMQRIQTLLAQKSANGAPFSARKDLLAPDGDDQFKCQFGPTDKWKVKTEPSGYAAWQVALDAEVEQASRAKIAADQALQSALPAQKSTHAALAQDQATRLEVLQTCSAAARAQRKLLDSAAVIANNTPVDVEVSLTESFDPSKFIVWADSVMTGSKDAAVKAIVDQADPVKRAADAKAALTARKQAEDEARQAWTDAKKAEIDLSALPEGSADKRKGQLDLDLKRRKVNHLYADLDWALPFPNIAP
jgi:hypothetical protein